MRGRLHSRLRWPDADPGLDGRAPRSRVITVMGHRLPRHGVRMAVIWLVLTAITVPLVVFVLGPHLPPGRMTTEAGAQTDANIVMTALVAPVVLLIWIYFAYSLVVFRARG